MSLEQRIDELESIISNQNQKIDVMLEMLEQLTGTKSNLVSTGEAALMLDVSVHTIREWYQQNKMPKNLGVGKHLKFERSAIEKMATAKKTGRPRKAA